MTAPLDDNFKVSQYALDYAVDSSLTSFLDQNVVIVTRDSILSGVLSSFDQIGNLVLRDAKMRITYRENYYERPMGVIIIRYDNTTCILQKDKYNNSPMVSMSLDELTELREKDEAKAKRVLKQMQ